MTVWIVTRRWYDNATNGANYILGVFNTEDSAKVAIDEHHDREASHIVVGYPFPKTEFRIQKWEVKGEETNNNAT